MKYLALAAKALLIVVGLAMGACATPALQAPDVRVTSRRLVAFPSSALVWTLDASDQRIIDEDASALAAKNIDYAVEQRLRRYGGRLVTSKEVNALSNGVAFYRWSQRALKEIITEQVHSGMVAQHKTVGDWTYTSNISGWRSALDADFVLVSLFLEGHNTTGRSLAVGFAGGTLAAERAIACAVHLRTGMIAWCDFQPKLVGDLSTHAGAQYQIDQMLSKMLLTGESVRSEPPPPPPPPASGGVAELTLDR